jgi:S-adenosylmethionine decarboxylase
MEVAMSDMRTRFQLGIDLDTRGKDIDVGDIAVDGAPSTAHAEETKLAGTAAQPSLNAHPGRTAEAIADGDPALDHWVVRNGRAYAGRHLIIDLWGGEGLDDIAHVDRTLRRGVEAADATLLHLHLHHFTPNGGVSGVAVLAESHISIHTWPEKAYAALDVFMCGDARPEEVIPVLERAFRPASVQVTEHLRGDSEPDGTEARKAA